MASDLILRVDKPDSAEQRQLFGILKRNLPSARRFFGLMQQEGFAAFGYRPTSLFLGRKLISSVSTVTMNIHGGGGLIRGIGITSVVTRASHQGRGFIRHLLEVVLSRIDRRPYAFAVLFTSKPEVYAKHGFKSAHQVNYTLDFDSLRAELPIAEAGLTVSVWRELSREKETSIRRIYQQYAKRHFGTLNRDTRRWKAYFTSLRLEPKDRILLLESHGTVVGYARIRLEQDEVLLGEAYCLKKPKGLSASILASICLRVAKEQKTRRIVLSLPRSHELIGWLTRNNAPLEKEPQSRRETLMLRLNHNNERRINKRLLNFNWCQFDTF